jgi:hypothetical protein
MFTGGRGGHDYCRRSLRAGSVDVADLRLCTATRCIHRCRIHSLIGSNRGSAALRWRAGRWRAAGRWAVGHRRAAGHWCAERSRQSAPGGSLPRCGEPLDGARSHGQTPSAWSPWTARGAADSLAGRCGVALAGWRVCGVALAGWRLCGVPLLQCSLRLAAVRRAVRWLCSVVRHSCGAVEADRRCRDGGD